MHTTTIEKFGRVHYNSDWSGDVILHVDRGGNLVEEVTIPGDMLRAVANLMLAQEEDNEEPTLEQALLIAMQYAKKAGIIASKQGRQGMSQRLSIAAHSVGNALFEVQREPGNV